MPYSANSAPVDFWRTRSPEAESRGFQWRLLPATPEDLAFSQSCQWLMGSQKSRQSQAQLGVARGRDWRYRFSPRFLRCWISPHADINPRSRACEPRWLEVAVYRAAAGRAGGGGRG